MGTRGRKLIRFLAIKLSRFLSKMFLQSRCTSYVPQSGCIWDEFRQVWCGVISFY